MARRIPAGPAPLAPLPPAPVADDPRTGIALMAIGVIVLPVMDGIAKYLGASYGPIQIAMMRFVTQILFTLPFALWFVGLRALVPRPFWLQMLRGTLIGAATMFFFAALRFMPIAETLAIFFVSPLLVTAISALILRERVGVRRWSAVVIGFLGAMIVIRPGSGIFGLPAVLPLCAATSFAFYLIVTRQLSGRSDPWSTNLQTGFSGMVFLLLVMLVADLLGFEGLGFIAIRTEHWLHFLAIGVISTAGHLLMIMALARAPASTVAPIGYLEMPSAALVGWIGFGDVPDFWAVVGIAVIISSGLYVSWRENQLVKRASRQ
ncbi:MAG: DMT family transporter [Rhodobiaceae bacterium]|nr:DMT family transporter [Rhodobiaceae bacterium]